MGSERPESLSSFYPAFLLLGRERRAALSVSACFSQLCDPIHIQRPGSP